MAKLPKKYVLKGYRARVYKTRAGWRKAIKKCQDDKHKGWLWDVVSLFRSRVCKQCKAHYILPEKIE